MNTSCAEAREVFLIEEQGLAAVRKRLGAEFVRAVELILDCPTRVVVTGIGKSGLVGQKITATLNSTGTPSFFLHPVEAMHGDLGMVASTDVVVAISYSGETRELNSLLGSLKKRGTQIIGMTGGMQSTLARAANVVLDIGVPKEACSLGLAPTASTTVTLAMGDALAVVLLNRKQFQPADFRENHPGGSLGERLKVRVEEVMLTGDAVPSVLADAPALDAMAILNQKNVGAVLIVDGQFRLKGIITDGDVRRFLVEGKNLAGMTAVDIMVTDPVSIAGTMLAADALSIMQRYEITALPIVDEADGHVQGVLHLHDLLGKGEFRFLI
ncbi:MAG: KpsF/GutQ family sugar-phosphate isomerase [Desulfobulbaceae bacterium]|uniref:KpsF/GutQ family sugar-phosphate isomerase n=1 Tax=Candidatus Desulfatifera sulfidica TaxID=2841691 RepID=A0A8J6NC73_9BACT|nr:KpsF/GutQ family sugar-phosphate isomerase [Candidatus Desulfatifera sulfidica]